MQRLLSVCAFLTLTLFANPAPADGPQDNVAVKVRRVPPPGKKLTDADRQELDAGALALGKEIADLNVKLKGKAALLELIPDVEIFYNAVRYALDYDEFFKDYDKKGQNAEVNAARKMLKLGHERAQQLKDGKAPWTTATGLVVRGYRSRIDGSVQPYGLVVPASFQVNSPFRHRLDIWFHGRGETLSELNFLNDRLQNPGQFTPAHAFVLHPYGRYCNANHFAGEVDTFEAMEHMQKYYPIDENRIVVRGFSMGGAACWHMAVHHAWRWAAAAPGAGFSETPQFLKVFQGESLEPTWYQKKLFHMYDCNDWALNLYNCPTVAYSGTKDSQKQAADVMAAAMDKIGLPLVHILGPDTGHSYHPTAKAEINRRIDSIVAKGRDPMPRRIQFTTWTLRYPRMHWLTVEGMEKHWEPATVTAYIREYTHSVQDGRTTIHVNPTNVTAFSLNMESGQCPFGLRPYVMMMDTYKSMPGPEVASDRSWTAHFRKIGKNWEIVQSFETDTLRKKPGLQGPIDDAFMDRFLIVRPTGKALNAKVEKWAAGELAHAREHWRSQFRGIAPVKDDAQVTDADIASSNLILWGDPRSNSILAKIAGKLPIAWSDKGVGGKAYSSDQHVPVLIYPNPLNPKKYVVINSGFTFREYDYLNNARQVPRLPDWAILDISEPPTSQWPSRVVEAGFFDERWQLGER